MDKDRLTKAKVRLQLKDRFLGALAMMAEWEENNEVPTMGTDGTRIVYNSNFINKLSMEELEGVIAHECLHIALQHPLRAEVGNYNKNLFNISADYVINQELVDNGMKLPNGGLLNREFRGLCTEEVYKILYKKADFNECNFSEWQCGGGNNSGEPEGKLPTDAMHGDVLKPNKDIHKIKSMIITASLVDKSSSWAIQGKEFKREFDKLTNPKLPWEVLLRKYVNGFFKDDFTWQRPNRRYQDMYLPSISDTEMLVSVNVYMDISGSVSDDMVTKFLSEIKGIYKKYALQHMSISNFSIGINDVIEMSDHWNPKVIGLHSRGGTEIDSVIEDINKRKGTINIIFTDGYFDESSIVKAKYPILWIIYSNHNFKPVKGKVIEITV